MKKVNKTFMGWSLLICFFVPLFIPSTLNTDGMGKYEYGFPFKYMTFYQGNFNSGWFFDNFFNGNDGLAINPFTFVINVLIIYLILIIVRSITPNKD